MNEELTTPMHAELLGNEITHYELKVMGVYGALARGVALNTALKEYDLTEKQYEEGVKKYLSE